MKIRPYWGVIYSMLLAIGWIFMLIFPLLFGDNYNIFYLGEINPEGEGVNTSIDSKEEVDTTENNNSEDTKDKAVDPIIVSEEDDDPFKKRYKAGFMTERMSDLYKKLGALESEWLEQEEKETIFSEENVVPQEDSIRDKIHEDRARYAKITSVLTEKLHAARLEDNPKDVGMSENKRTISENTSMQDQQISRKRLREDSSDEE
jgi:hypothetical protein